MSLQLHNRRPSRLETWNHPTERPNAALFPLQKSRNFLFRLRQMRNLLIWIIVSAQAWAVRGVNSCWSLIYGGMSRGWYLIISSSSAPSDISQSTDTRHSTSRPFEQRGKLNLSPRRGLGGFIFRWRRTQTLPADQRFGCIANMKIAKWHANWINCERQSCHFHFHSLESRGRDT